MKVVELHDLGLIDYKEAWDLQEKIFASIVQTKLINRTLPTDSQSKKSHYFLFCEHPPVYTLGKSGQQKHLLLSQQKLKEKGIAFYKINRGGDITFHGPGQIVGYPLLDLDEFYTDLGRYLRNLEEVVIRVLAQYNLRGERLKGATGVWLDADNPFRARKICAMGIRASRWVTMHGFALNVNTNLTYFNYIVPCGISDKAVTSLEKELGIQIPLNEVKSKLTAAFEEVFQVKLQLDENLTVLSI